MAKSPRHRYGDAPRLAGSPAPSGARCGAGLRHGPPPPSRFEGWFLSAAHTARDRAATRQGTRPESVWYAFCGACPAPGLPDCQRAARRGHQSRPAQGGRSHDHARVLGIDAHRALARRRRSVRPGVVRGRRGPGRATDGGRLGHGTDCLERRPVLPGRRPRRSPQPGQRPLRNRTRRQGVLARLRPVLPVRHPDHPRHRPRSPLHPRRASDERDREARPRAVRRHGRLHRPCLRRVLDPRVRVRPAHPRPAVEAAVRVRTRSVSRSSSGHWSAAR